jgi:hypothetical protein
MAERGASPPMQSKGIPDHHVLWLAWRWRQDPRCPCALDALVAEGVPAKLAAAKIERLVARGLLDYGVSVRCPWPTGRSVRG